MTMHIVRGMTIINTRKRRRNKQPGEAKSIEAHNQWLRKRGLHPDQLKLKEKSSGASIPDYAATRSKIKTSDVVTPITGKRKAQEYSGDYIIGIATMHKSNLVPVGKGQSPEELAKMRR